MAVNAREYLSVPLLEVALLFTVLLSGTFSISRVWPPAADMPLLDEVRYILLALLIVLLLVPRRATSWREIPRSVYVWVGVVFALHAYLAISWLWTRDRAAAAPFLIDVALLAIFPLIAVVVARRHGPPVIKYVLGLTLLAAAAFAVAGLANVSQGADRASAFTGGPNVFVRIVGAGALVTLLLWHQRRTSAWLVPLGALVAMAALSGSRGGFLALLVALCVLVAILPRLRLRTTPSARGVRTFALALAVIAVVIVPAREVLLERYVDLTLVERYDSGRKEAFAQAWNLFEQSPIVGAGYYSSAGGEVSHPHNIFLHIASDGGLIGLALFLVPFAVVAIHYRRGATPVGKTCLAIGALYGVASLFSGIYYDHRFMWFYLTLFILTAPSASTAVESRAAEANSPTKRKRGRVRR